MIELNLLEKKEPLRLPVVLGLDLNDLNLVMLFIALIIWYVPQSVFDSYNEGLIKEKTTQLEEVREKGNVLKKELGKNGKIKDVLKAYQDQVEKLKIRSSQVDEILKIRTNPKKILEKLARSATEDLWFDSLSIASNNDVTITGGSYSSRNLGEFITIINDSPYFAGSMTPIKQENKQESFDGSVVSYEAFELKGKVKSFDMRVK